MENMRTMNGSKQYVSNDKADCSVTRFFGKSVKDLEEPDCDMADSEIRCRMAILCNYKGTSNLCNDPLHAALHVGLVHDRDNIDGTFEFIDMLCPNTIHVFSERGVLTYEGGNCKHSHIDLMALIEKRRGLFRV